MNDNPMLAHAKSVSPLIRDIFTQLELKTRTILTTPEIFEIRHMILFGCGDSFSAAEGAANVFLNLCGFTVQIVPTMTASRYLAQTLPILGKHVLAVGVSNSGAPARIVEAMKAMSAHGARTLAVTGDPESPMAQVADRVLEVQTPPFEPEAPGIRSYVVAQITLYLLAIRISEVTGQITMAKSDAYREELRSSGTQLERGYGKVKDFFEPFAKTISRCGRLELLASGACRGSADFGAAKLIEANGMDAVSQDVEEFAHLNLFRRDPAHLPTILLAPSDDPSYGRCTEVAKALETLQRPFLMLTDAGTSANGILPVTNEPISPLFAPLLLSCLLYYLIAAVDTDPKCAYFQGHTGPWSEKDFPDVRHSSIKIY